MSRVSFEHVRRGVIRHITGVGPELEGTFVIKMEWVVVVLLVVVVVQMVRCGSRKKIIFKGTKQIPSGLRSVESVFPVLRRWSRFSPVTGRRGGKDIINSRGSRRLKVCQELGGGERDIGVCDYKLKERRRRNIPASNCIVVENLHWHGFLYFQRMPLGECKNAVWGLLSLQ